jgi:hypothetical protein
LYIRVSGARLGSVSGVSIFARVTVIVYRYLIT